MRDQESQELDSGHEAVVGAEARVEIAAVEDKPVGAHLKPFEGNGGPLHVFQQGLQPLSIFGFHPAIGVDLETRVDPRPEELRPVLGDLPSPDHQAEDLGTKDLFEGLEVEILGGVEVAQAIEKSG